MSRAGNRGRGKQVGKQGVAHSQRTDLNEPPSGEVYGEQAEMQSRLDALPIQPAPVPVQRPALVAPLPLTRPTEREWEPITAGLDSGPGPGSEVLGLGGPIDELRALYRRFPFEELREAIEEIEA